MLFIKQPFIINDNNKLTMIKVHFSIYCILETFTTMVTTYEKIPIDVSIYLRYLYQHGGVKGKALTDRFPKFSKRSIYRHAKLPVGEKAEDKRMKNKGRPRKICSRDKRHVASTINRLRRSEEGVFTSVHVQQAAGLSNVSNRTVRRHLNEQGYGYLQCRKKGLLTENDCKNRLEFAKNIQQQNLPENFWENGIGFYIDGVSFVHKTNPCSHAKSARTRTWRKKNEGLSIHSTAKAKKEGTGGSVAKFMVSIAYGQGVIGVHQYFGSINGEKYAQMVRQYFPDLLKNGANPGGKYFVQDNDPSQNSALAKEALKEVKAQQFHIPARSPDLNPIENVFHLISKKIRVEAKLKHIERENFGQFSERCKRNLRDFSPEIIDNTISSMNKRIQMVIDNVGQRTKY